jgi:pyruvate formate lyase activating enzyme
MTGTITGTVFDLRRYSIHDGPGIRTAVFFKGCLLACRWCHNPEGGSFSPELIFRPSRCILCNDCLDICPNGAIERSNDEIHLDRTRCRISGICAVACPAEALEIVGMTLSVDQVLARIEADRIFYEQSHGGVTFTGGEPLAQPRFLQALLVNCHEKGLNTAVDTSGYAPWPVFEDILPYVDLFLYDLKLMDDERHCEWTGVSNVDILSNLRNLSAAGQELLVRIPLIPGINEDDGNLLALGEFIASLPHVPSIELLAYHNMPLQSIHRSENNSD